MNIVLFESNAFKLEKVLSMAKEHVNDVTILKVSNVHEMMSLLENDNASVDGIFVDLQSIVADDFEQFAKVKEEHKNIAVVFYGDLIPDVDIYDIEHLYYTNSFLVDSNFVKACEKVRCFMRENVFYFTANRYMHKMKLSEILYLESDKRVCHLYDVKGKCYDFYRKLDDVARDLGDSFFRCSKSYLINRAYISSFTRDSVTINTGLTFSITRKYGSGGGRKQFAKSWKQFQY